MPIYESCRIDTVNFHFLCDDAHGVQASTVNYIDKKKCIQACISHWESLACNYMAVQIRYRSGVEQTRSDIASCNAYSQILKLQRKYYKKKVREVE